MPTIRSAPPIHVAHVDQCFGGPMHGKRHVTSAVRFECVDDFVREPVDFLCHPISFADMPQRQIATYTVRRYRQFRGAMRKEVPVAIVDGGELSRREEHELQRWMETQRWDWPEPSILRDFDQWFKWNLYQNHRRASRRTEWQCRQFDAHGRWLE
jgi:hypothetical protein